MRFRWQDWDSILVLVSSGQLLSAVQENILVTHALFNIVSLGCNGMGWHHCSSFVMTIWIAFNTGMTSFDIMFTIQQDNARSHVSLVVTSFWGCIKFLYCQLADYFSWPCPFRTRTRTRTSRHTNLVAPIIGWHLMETSPRLFRIIWCLQCLVAASHKCWSYLIDIIYCVINHRSFWACCSVSSYQTWLLSIDLLW